MPSAGGTARWLLEPLQIRLVRSGRRHTECLFLLRTSLRFGKEEDVRNFERKDNKFSEMQGNGRYRD
jgi:hypothetical protein